MDEPTTLQTPKMIAPFDFANSIAARVSAVSPDCEIAITTSPSRMMGFLYLNSDAYSTSTGIRQNSSIMYSATKPACHDVPQATIIILSALTSLLAYSRIPPSTNLPVCASSLPRKQSLMDLGCSNISLIMK